MFSESKFLSAPLALSISVLIFGMLFKIMHWSYNTEIISISFLSIIVLYFSRYLHKKERRFFDHVKLFFVVSWSVSGIFIILHLPFSGMLKIISSIAFILLAVVYFNDNKIDVADTKTKKSRVDILFSILFVIASVGVVTGAVFKIMHWPFSAYLLTGGAGAGCIYITREFFK